MLSKYQPPIPLEIVERIESVRWIFTRVVDRIPKAMDEILMVQAKHQEDLRERSLQVRDEIDDFVDDFRLVSSILLNSLEATFCKCINLRLMLRSISLEFSSCHLKRDKKV